MVRIILASFEHNKIWCAAKKASTVEFLSPVARAPSPGYFSHNLFECARQAKFLRRRITTDLTLSRPTDGRLRVSAGGSGSFSVLFSAPASPGTCLDRPIRSIQQTLHPEPHGPPWGFPVAPDSFERNERCNATGSWLASLRRSLRPGWFCQAVTPGSDHNPSSAPSRVFPEMQCVDVNAVGPLVQPSVF